MQMVIQFCYQLTDYVHIVEPWYSGYYMSIELYIGQDLRYVLSAMGMYINHERHYLTI